jgi:hypothetical protein
MGNDFAGRGDPVGERRKAVVALDRVAGCDQEPQPIEPQAPHGHQRHMAMTLMGRIEAASEEANALVPAVGRKMRDHVGGMAARSPSFPLAAGGQSAKVTGQVIWLLHRLVTQALFGQHNRVLCPVSCMDRPLLARVQMEFDGSSLERSWISPVVRGG